MLVRRPYQPLSPRRHCVRRCLSLSFVLCFALLLAACGGGSSGSSPSPNPTPPPTVPGNLTATATSASQINLNWTASTSTLGIANYVVKRCQGAGCSSFAQVAAPVSASFNDTGLAASTSYSY